MKYKTLSSFNLKDKTVLVRSDLNSDLKNGKPIISDRIRESVKTISELKRKKAKVIIMAHQGRPKTKNFTSLREHAKLLSKFTKVKFVSDVIGLKAIKAIKNLKPGQALLLENVRTLKQEYHPDRSEFERYLVPLFDIYINDAFSNSHRNNASVVSFPKYIKKHGIGRLMEKELKALEKIKSKKGLYILGGAKPEDNIKLLKSKNKVIATGLFDSLCLMAKGQKLGKQELVVKKYKPLIKKIKNKVKKVGTSIDFIDETGKIISINELPLNKKLLGIGPKTIENIKSEIKKYKVIFMKGPAGVYHGKRFAGGTKEILKAIAKNKGTTILGGGHLNTFLEEYKISKSSFTYVSLSGGALIAYLAGEKLPGLEVLKRK
ncbi:MAG: phosphoglycerate kinase [Candidatus Nanoarchaeia archaeon]